MTDREFDRLLYAGAEGLVPGEEEARPPDPWRRALGRACWGIALNTITLRFWHLDVLLPSVGLVLLWLGLRALRREDGWFRAAFRLSTLLTALRLSIYAAQATPLRLWLTQGLTPFALLCSVLFLAALFCLWRGLRGVFRRAGQPPRTGAAGALVLCDGLMLLLALLETDGLLAWGFLLAWIALLVSLFKLSRSLDRAGYALAPAPVRLSDRWAAALWLGTAALVLLGGLLGFARLPVRGEAARPADPDSQLRVELRGMGFPAEALADLTDEEAARFAGAKRLEVYESRSDDVWDRWGKVRQTRSVVQVTAHLEGDRMVCLYHFTWNGTPASYMDGVEISPVGDDRALTARVEDPPRGRLLWREGGADMAMALEPVCDYRGFYGGSNAAQQSWCMEFSLPRGEAVRGYALWSVDASRTSYDGVNFNIPCAYYHQNAPRYPYARPREVFQADQWAPSSRSPYQIWQDWSLAQFRRED